MRPTTDIGPVGKFIIISIGIVGEASLLDQQPTRVHAGCVPAIPADWTLADRRLERLDRHSYMIPLRCLVKLVVLDPAPTVTADIVPRLTDRRRSFRMAFQG